MHLSLLKRSPIVNVFDLCQSKDKKWAVGGRGCGRRSSIRIPSLLLFLFRHAASASSVSVIVACWFQSRVLFLLSFHSPDFILIYLDIYIRFRFYIFFSSERHANSDLFRLSRPSPCPLRLLQSSKDPRIQVANGNLASVSSTPCCPSTPAIALVLSANEEPCFWPSKSGMNLNVECAKQIKHPIYYTRYLKIHVCCCCSYRNNALLIYEVSSVKKFWIWISLNLKQQYF